MRSVSVRNFLRRRIAFGVISTSSSSSMNSSACSSENLIGGIRPSSSSLPDARKLVSCLPRRALTVRSLSLRVDADDLAFVDLLARLDEQAAAFLHRDLRVGRRRAGAVGDQHAVLALADLAFGLRAVMVEHVEQQAGAGGDACGTRSGNRSGRARGSGKSMRTRPLPSGSMFCSSALRSPRRPSRRPGIASSMSTTSDSIGSVITPSMFLMITSGRETASS